MSHARAQIRAALVTRITGLATTGARVYAHRYHVFSEADLPGLRVYAAGEDKLDEYAGGRQQRRVVFVIEACARALSAIEDSVDQIALEVETAIAADQTLGGLVGGGVRYDGIDEFREEHAGEKPVGVWPLRFVGDYNTDAKTPQTIA